jgi:hypothetical protein
VAIEYTVGGEDYELCRSDMRNAVALQIAVKKMTPSRKAEASGPMI